MAGGVSKKLSRLKKKQDELKAQIQNLEAAEKTRERKRETRRKILIGACYLDKAKQNDTLGSLIQELDGYLNRNADRVLFDLPPIEKKIFEQ